MMTSRPGAPALSVRAQARVDLAVAAQQISDYARSLVASQADAHLEPGELVVCTMRLRAMSLALVDAAIRVERAAGASWEDIAAARRVDVDELIAEHPDAADEQTILEAVSENLTDGVQAALAQLDRWYAETARPHDEGTPPAHAASTDLF